MLKDQSTNIKKLGHNTDGFVGMGDTYVANISNGHQWEFKFNTYLILYTNCQC